MKLILGSALVLGTLGAGAAIALRLMPPVEPVQLVREQRQDTRQLVVERLSTETLLVSAQQKMSATVTVDRDRAVQLGLFRLPLPSHSLTYTLHGTASIGYDLGLLTREDVSFADDTMTIRIGSPLVVAFDMDHELTQSSNDAVPPEMVNDAINTARTEIIMALCDTEAYATAEYSAKQTIAGLLQLADHQVEVVSDRPVCPG